MGKYIQYSIVAILIAFVFSCKSISKYTIDDKPLIKMDSSLLGIWKAVEDTDKANYILIQSSYDTWQHTDRWYHLSYSEKRDRIYKSFAERNMPIDTESVDMLAKTTDTSGYIKKYQEFIKNKDYLYYITYFNMHGINPEYQQWGSFMSVVNKTQFLNIPYNYIPYVNDSFIRAQEEEGYFFVRLININTAHDTMTVAVVADKTLKYLGSSKDVRERIAKNINNPAFYSDTLHFYKANDYHLELTTSISKVN